MAMAKGRGRQDVRGRSLLKEMKKRLKQIRDRRTHLMCVGDDGLLPVAEF